MDLHFLISFLWPLIFISPAYAANSSPLFLSNIIKKLHPLDFNKKFLDKERILGDGKTIEGTLFGIFVGYSYFLIFYFFDKTFNILNLYNSVLEGLMLVIGAVLGDIFGSFIKRRLKISQGEMLPIFDQIGFIIFAFIFYSFIFKIWFSIDVILYICFITFFIHIFTNFTAYKFGVKKEPF